MEPLAGKRSMGIDSSARLILLLKRINTKTEDDLGQPEKTDTGVKNLHGADLSAG